MEITLYTYMIEKYYAIGKAGLPSQITHSHTDQLYKLVHETGSPYADPSSASEVK